VRRRKIKPERNETGTKSVRVLFRAQPGVLGHLRGVCAAKRLTQKEIKKEMGGSPFFFCSKHGPQKYVRRHRARAYNEIRKDKDVNDVDGGRLTSMPVHARPSHGRFPIQPAAASSVSAIPRPLPLIKLSATLTRSRTSYWPHIQCMIYLWRRICHTLTATPTLQTAVPT
jgi:hypothetical protein